MADFQCRKYEVNGGREADVSNEVGELNKVKDLSGLQVCALKDTNLHPTYPN